jgi:nicotinate dehydrogenase subunit B
VEIEVIDRPSEPFLGVGEAAQGPAAAALANALADATGKRLRDLPLTAEKVKAAMG